jgi:hypothetical protein
MTGDTRLAHPEHILQFRDRKFFLFEEQDQAETGRISQEPEKING